jgi:hypothetical protein
VRGFEGGSSTLGLVYGRIINVRYVFEPSFIRISARAKILVMLV